MKKNEPPLAAEPTPFVDKIHLDDYAGDAEDQRIAIEQSNAYMDDLDRKPNDHSSDIRDRESG